MSYTNFEAFFYSKFKLIYALIPYMRNFSNQ